MAIIAQYTCVKSMSNTLSLHNVTQQLYLNKKMSKHQQISDHMWEFLRHKSSKRYNKKIINRLDHITFKTVVYYTKQTQI